MLIYLTVRNLNQLSLFGRKHKVLLHNQFLKIAEKAIMRPSGWKLNSGFFKGKTKHHFLLEGVNSHWDKWKR